MPENTSSRAGFSVGSLIGLPLGATAREGERGSAGSPIADTIGATNPPPAEEIEGPGWAVDRGRVGRPGRGQPFGPDGVEVLTYDNPFGQVMERVWYDGKVVYAVDLGEVDVDETKVKVAQEYQVVYDVTLDERGKAVGDPEMVPGQLNIYDSVPGQAKYSPIWQFNYVVVPRDYAANTLSSAEACEASGYRIVRSRDFEN